jgi:hypothetical protein
MARNPAGLNARTLAAKVRAGGAALPLVCAYDSLECVWSPPMPVLFQRPHGAEFRALSGGYIRDCINHVVAQSGLSGPDSVPLRHTPHDFRRLFVTDAIRSGLPAHIAAAICGHASLDTTMGYAKARELHQTGDVSPGRLLRAVSE